MCRQGKRQAGIAACHRMTALVPLAGVEEQDMIGIGDGLIATDVPQVNPAIGEYKVRHRNVFLHASMTTLTAAPNVSQRHGIRVEQMRDLEHGWSRHAGKSIPKVLPASSVLCRRLANSAERSCSAAIVMRMASDSGPPSRI